MAENKIPYKDRTNTASSRKATSERMRALWANPEWRAKILKRPRPSPEAISRGQAKKWTDPINGPRLRSEARDRMTARMNTPEEKARVSAMITEFNKTDRAKALRSVSSAANWANPETSARMKASILKARALRLQNETPNDFEARCYSFLDSCGIPYEKQHPIIEAYTIPDAYISELRICLYFDSEYWHSRPENVEIDARVRGKLIELGYAVMVIKCDHWGREINQSDLDAIRTTLCHRWS